MSNGVAFIVATESIVGDLEAIEMDVVANPSNCHLIGN